MERNDIPVERLEELYSPFQGEYTVSVDDNRQLVYVEDANGQTVCSFNERTQLPLTDANMEWEYNFWVDRAYQICNMLNHYWYKHGDSDAD